MVPAIPASRCPLLLAERALPCRADRGKRAGHVSASASSRAPIAPPIGVLGFRTRRAGDPHRDSSPGISLERTDPTPRERHKESGSGRRPPLRRDPHRSARMTVPVQVRLSCPSKRPKVDAADLVAGRAWMRGQRFAPWHRGGDAFEARQAERLICHSVPGSGRVTADKPLIGLERQDTSPHVPAVLPRALAPTICAFPERLHGAGRQGRTVRAHEPAGGSGHPCGSISVR
jgi:hypothetical protein